MIDRRRSTLASLVLAVLCAAVPARAVPVEFNVRMAHQIERGAFDPATEFVDVAGTFNDWGAGPILELSDADGDSVYTITLDVFSVGQVFEYKFRQNAQWDGTEEFPGVGRNRMYTVQPSGNVIDVWYDDRAPDLGRGELSWWNDTVFYEIFVRSFQDSDGDGIGDFPGLTQRLDYLNDGDPATTDDLGVTGIWLMPIHDSPSYHGYDVVDYRSIHPDYGTMADFQAFLDAAHARGIKVIIDFVMNHASSQHPWFVASRQNDPQYRDWFRWSPTVLDESGPWGQTVWHPSGGDYFYGVFWSGMPDLNYDTPAVKTAMFDAATFWLDTIGVDGFRLDAVLYIDEEPGQLSTTQGTLDFWQDYDAHVKSVAPDVLSVGEAWTNSSTVNRYVTDDRLDLAFEFDLASTILGAVNAGDATGLAWKANEVYGLYPYLQFATFLTNHDQNRVMNVLGEDVGRGKAAAGILLTLPGVPFLYYGEEVGQLGVKPDPDIRLPMQWTGGANAGFTTGTPWRAPGANYEQFNVEAMQPDPNSLWSWYRDLVAARNGSPALRRGDFEVLPASAPSVLGFLRRDPDETVLVVANTGPDGTGFDLVDANGALVADPLVLENLLDPGDRPTVTRVDGVVDGLFLDGYQVAVYRLQSDATGIDDPIEPPVTGDATSVQLRPNVPNPFDGETTINYRLATDAEVRLSVYDLAGREVALLRDGQQEAGAYSVVWNGQDERRRRLGAGVYFLRLAAGEELRVRKIVLAP